MKVAKFPPFTSRAVISLLVVVAVVCVQQPISPALGLKSEVVVEEDVGASAWVAPAVGWVVRIGGWALEIWGGYEAVTYVVHVLSDEDCVMLSELGRFGEWISRARPGDTHPYTVVCQDSEGNTDKITFDVTYNSSVDN